MTFLLPAPSRPKNQPLPPRSRLTGLDGLRSALGRRPWAWALFLAIGSLGAAPSEPSAVPGHDFASFKLIPERNIFNASRSAGSGPAGNGEVKKAARVETLTLVGTMLYEAGEKGPYAFFEGSSAEYRQVLTSGKSIAGYTLAEIGRGGIRLDAGDQRLEVRVGTSLRREEEGPWQVIAAPAAALPSPSGSSEAAGDETDLVKKLMQQREQELK